MFKGTMDNIRRILGELEEYILLGLKIEIVSITQGEKTVGGLYSEKFYPGVFFFPPNNYLKIKIASIHLILSPVRPIKN